MPRLPLSLLLLVLAAPAAFAQSPCGELGEWAGGSAETADLSQADAAIDFGVNVTESAPHVTAFTVTTTAEIRLEALPDGTGDTVIELRDAATGTILLEDDDGGGGLASRIETTLDPGTYCLRTRGYGEDATPAMVRLGRTEHVALTSATPADLETEVCTADTPAVPLSLGEQSTETVGDVPFYRFSLTQPTALTLTAQNDSADPALRLFDEGGLIVAENDDADGLNARIDMTDPLAAGTYCIGVRTIGDSDAPIAVRLAAFDPEAAARRLFASGEASPPLGGDYPVEDLGAVTGEITKDLIAQTDMAWFRFEMAEDGLMLIDGVGLGPVDPTVVLFDAAGRPVARDDDGGRDMNAQLAARLQPGHYMVGIGQNSDGGFGLLRLVLQRFVPAE